jgi:hypothetical protein
MTLRFRYGNGIKIRSISRPLIYKIHIVPYKTCGLSFLLVLDCAAGRGNCRFAADQRTETFFIFPDLCLTKKAASILFVRTGAFWIWRPLGLSRELNDAKCLGPG